MSFNTFCVKLTQVFHARWTSTPREGCARRRPPVTAAWGTTSTLTSDPWATPSTACPETESTPSPSSSPPTWLWQTSPSATPTGRLPRRRSDRTKHLADKGIKDFDCRSNIWETWLKTVWPFRWLPPEMFQSDHFINTFFVEWKTSKHKQTILTIKNK